MQAGGHHKQRKTDALYKVTAYRDLDDTMLMRSLVFQVEC